jgi:hypothetical protein
MNSTDSQFLENFREKMKIRILCEEISENQTHRKNCLNPTSDITGR